MTTEGTNEAVRNASPTLDRPKQQLPTLRIKKRKIALNLSSNSDRNNRQQKASVVVAAQQRKYGSIPTFRQPPRRPHTSSSVPTFSSAQIEYNGDSDDDDHCNERDNAEFDDDTIDHYIANTVESLETYIAIQSLQQSIETCITVPSTDTTTVAATGTTFHHIRGVLECQIFEYFTPVPSSSSSSSSFATSTSNHNNAFVSNRVTMDDHHNSNQKCSVSKQKILKQLRHLQQQNVITCIPIVQDQTSHNFYLFTKDYVEYVEQQQQRMLGKETSKSTSADARSQSEIILKWWIRQLRSKHTIRTQGQAPYLTVHDFEQAWYHDPPRHSSDSVPPQEQQRQVKSLSTTLPLLSASVIIQHLQDAQLILSASYDHCTYQLWLPKVWGTMVLPKFSQLCKDVILYIKRSSYRERSMVSILERFHNHRAATPQQRPLTTIPTAKRIRGTTYAAKVANVDTDVYISIPHVIIPYLISQRRVQRIVRPSGMFLTFIE